MKKVLKGIAAAFLCVWIIAFTGCALSYPDLAPAFLVWDAIGIFLLILILRKPRKKKQPAVTQTYSDSVFDLDQRQTIKAKRGSYSIMEAKGHLRILQDCLTLFEKTKNLDTFFSRYEYGMQIALKLDQGAKAGIIPSTTDFSDVFVKAATSQLERVLLDSYEEQSAKIGSLKTAQAKASHWNQYLATLEKYENYYASEPASEYSYVVEKVNAEIDQLTSPAPIEEQPDPDKDFKSEGFPKVLDFVKRATTTGATLVEITDAFQEVSPTSVKYVVRKLTELGDLTKQKSGRYNRYFATVLLDPDYTEKWNLPKPEPENPYEHLKDILIGPDDPAYRVHPDIEGLLWFADGPMKNYQPGDHPEYDQYQSLLGPWNGIEPSAIRSDLEICRPTHWDEIPRVPYYPSYSVLMPEQRWIFLAWLRTPYEPIEAGYAFLLYYCLKRRVALDSQLPRCVNLLTKLLEVQQNGSFQGYASDLLELARMKSASLPQN